MSQVTAVIRRLNWGYLLIGSLLVLLGTAIISKTSFGAINPDPSYSIVDNKLGDGDLACTTATDDPYVSNMAPIIFVDGEGGYATAAETMDGYYKKILPQLPMAELQITQSNDLLVRYEVSGKAVFIVEKTVENLWQPGTYSLCPGLGWYRN